MVAFTMLHVEAHLSWTFLGKPSSSTFDRRVLYEIQTVARARSNDVTLWPWLLSPVHDPGATIHVIAARAASTSIAVWRRMKRRRQQSAPRPRHNRRLQQHRSRQSRRRCRRRSIRHTSPGRQPRRAASCRKRARRGRSEGAEGRSAARTAAVSHPAFAVCRVGLKNSWYVASGFSRTGRNPPEGGCYE